MYQKRNMGEMTMNQQDYYNPNEDFIERMLRNPKNVLNLIMIAANVLIFVLVAITGGSNDMENMIRWGAAYTPLIQAGETYRLFTSMFLHFGISHLFNNMLLLLFVGDYLEKTVGKPVYLAVYVLGGLVGNVCSCRYEISEGRAVLGAIVILLILNKGRLEDLSLRRVCLMVVLTLLVGFQSSNVDNYAHIGGFIGGMAVMLILSPVYLMQRKKQKKNW